jgi:hypothetical protein
MITIWICMATDGGGGITHLGLSGIEFTHTGLRICVVSLRAIQLTRCILFYLFPHSVVPSPHFQYKKGNLQVVVTFPFL